MIDPGDIAAARHRLGRQLACYRRAAGLGQHQLAPLTHYGRSTIGNVEIGRQNVPRGFWEHCDRVLQADGALLRGYGQLCALIARQRRETAKLEAQQTPVPVPTLAGPPGDHHEDAGLAATRSFRAADSRVGGGHLYATVVQYLHTEIAPRLFGSTPAGSGATLYSSAAALTDMAGWMAHDAGRDPIAAQHFSRALDLARTGGDTQLSAHIMASLSHLAHRQGQPTEAIRLARAGRHKLGVGYRHSHLAAKLLALEARGHAAERDAESCTTTLRQAEKALDKSASVELSPWVSPFDAGSLANEVARSLLTLGHLGIAQQQAEVIMQVRPAHRARSRTFGQLLLARILLAKNQPEAACAAITDALPAVPTLSSYLVNNQLIELGRHLTPLASNSVVDQCLVSLREVVQATQPFTLWISQEHAT